MYQYNRVELCIARILKIKSSQIQSWTIKSEAINGGCINNHLEIRCRAMPGDFERFKERHGSIISSEIRVGEFSFGSLDGSVEITLALLYGKETQHIFKALYQVMTVRKPKRK